MIEVEKKFIPTEENLKMLLTDAEFLGEVTNHDIYYDYPDYRFLKGDIALRKRNGRFELKIQSGSGIHEEIEDIEKIKEYFNTSDLQEFINETLISAIEYRTVRKKYKKEDFSIDIDETDFGYQVGEIELMVDNEADVKNAEDKIESFALRNNLELGTGLSKKRAYFKKLNIEL
ncbi:MAG: CYTH domain-containing protein [Candidatus Paceibacterota bacterium]